MIDVEERFWAKVDRSGDCWLWTGTLTRGYGHFKIGGRCGRLVYAHRFAYELANGTLPLRLDHRVTCPKHCVNPAHLRPVTHKQNMENRAGVQSNSMSGVRGVTWHKRNRKWVAYLTHYGERVYLGSYFTIEEAEVAVVAKRNELFTHNDADRVMMN